MNYMRTLSVLLLSALLMGCGGTGKSSPSAPKISPSSGAGHPSTTETRPTPSQQAAPQSEVLGVPLTVGAVNRLHVLPEPAIVVAAGKFTPAEMKQWLVGIGSTGEGIDETAILFFKDGHYDHKVVLPGAGGILPLSYPIQWNNKFLNLGKREKLYRVADFNGSGLDQIFMLQESGMAFQFSVYGFANQKLQQLLSVTIDSTYAYPIQTVGPGVLKIFPKNDSLERVSETTYKLRYLVYSWNNKTQQYSQTGDGVQMAWWDRGAELGPLPMTYPLSEKP